MYELITLSIPGLLRGIAGWAENAFEDGKLTLPEWKLLGSTLMRVGMISSSMYYGWNYFSDTQADAFATGFAAVLFDFVYVRVKKFKK